MPSHLHQDMLQGQADHLNPRLRFHLHCRRLLMVVLGEVKEVKKAEMVHHPVMAVVVVAVLLPLLHPLVLHHSMCKRARYN